MPARVVLFVLLALAVAGCAGDARDEAPAEETPASASAPGPDEWHEPPPDADTEGIDMFDPAYSLLPESHAAEQRLIRRLGRRADFRIPRSAVAELPDGALARAVVARIWHEVDPSDDRYRDLNAGQRALLAIQWADAEILNGGFSQLWMNSTGAVAPDLVAAALRVGARDHAVIFADAERLFHGGRIPRDRGAREKALDTMDGNAIAALDDRYGDMQYYRRTLLAPILANYVRSHPRDFFAG